MKDTLQKESLAIISEHVNYSKTNLDGIITEVSDAFCKSSQYTRDELIGQQHNITRHPDMPASAFKEMWDTIQSGQKWEGKVKNQSKDGGYYWSQTVITPNYDSDNHIVEYMAIRHNITAQEQLKEFKKDLEYKVESKIKELENNLITKKALLDSSHDGIVIINSDNKCIAMNATGLKMYQINDESEAIGINIFENVTKDSIELIKQHMLKADPEPYEISCLRKDGSPYPALIKGKTITLDGEVVRISSIMDMTDIKIKEKLLIEQSKMAAMGEMIESIAHQWRQPLSAISTEISGMEVNKEFGILTDELFSKTCKNILDSTIYLSETIDDFRNFFKKDKIKNRFNIKNIFDKTITLIKSQFKNKEIEIIKTIEDINMYGFGNELVQVFINILNNAKDELELQNINRMIFIDIYIENEKAIIKIKDNAGGVPKDILPKIFDSHFTTKENKDGTGIGLYMTKKIIKDSFKGTIAVSNIDYEYDNFSYTGAEFKIILPI